jgi:hypothetical protein
MSEKASITICRVSSREGDPVIRIELVRKKTNGRERKYTVKMNMDAFACAITGFGFMPCTLDDDWPGSEL